MEKKPEPKVEFLPYEPRMQPGEPGKLNYKRAAIISLAFFTVLLAWSYFNFKVPKILEAELINLGLVYGIELIVGIIMALDNIVAVILQPFFGDLSDRTKSRFGRRMPFIIIGTLSAAFFFSLIPLIRMIVGLILIILLFDVAMSIYRSASIAILPDYTDAKVYSKASALQQFIANMGGLIGFSIPLILHSSIFPSDYIADFFAFFTVSVIMVVLLIVQNLFIKETPTGDSFLKISEKRLDVDPSTFKAVEIEKGTTLDKPMPRKKFSSYGEAINIMKEDRNFAYFLGTVIFMYLAFASVETFFSLFCQNYLGIEEDAASTLFLFYSGPMIAVAFFVGLLGQNKKIGRKNAVKIFLTWLLISLIVMSIIVFSLYQNHNQTLMIIMLIMVAVPWMGFIVNSFPILWELAPEGDVGIYTGIYYTFNQSAYALAPVLFGGLLSIFAIPLQDGLNYIIMFPFILICALIAYLLFFKVKGGEAPEED